MIQWTLTEKEADYVMSLLNARPHGEVRALIDKLMQQANKPPVEGPV